MSKDQRSTPRERLEVLKDRAFCERFGTGQRWWKRGSDLRWYVTADHKPPYIGPRDDPPAEVLNQEALYWRDLALTECVASETAVTNGEVNIKAALEGANRQGLESFRSAARRTTNDVAHDELARLSSFLSQMVHQYGHPDWSAKEMLEDLGDVSVQLASIANALKATPSATTLTMPKADEVLLACGEMDRDELACAMSALKWFITKTNAADRGSAHDG